MIRVGTSGFSFPEWVGTFYPPGTKDGARMLSHYAGHLDTVEMNYTFRRHPSPSTLSVWRAAVPPSFRITLKAHHSITHRARLKEPGRVAGLFWSRALQLGDCLGGILLQLPPSMRADPERLARFCAALPADVRPRAAFEFRHASWFSPEVYAALREAGCALVLAETDDTEARGEPTAALVYVRLRRDDYPDERLRAWAARLREMESSGHEVLCYLKHDDDAPRLARRLRELLDRSPTA